MGKRWIGGAATGIVGLLSACGGGEAGNAQRNASGGSAASDAGDSTQAVGGSRGASFGAGGREAAGGAASLAGASNVVSDANGGSAGAGGAETGGAPSSGCGDGIIQYSERCDGRLFAGADCASELGKPLAHGTLSCTAECRIDTSGCEYCGDGKRDPSEECEGTDLGGATCTTLLGTAASGAPTCGTDCKLVSSGCGRCGDGIANGTEACDGKDFGTNTCATALKRSALGSLGCTAACDLDTTGCSYCGDGIRKGGEACEGADLGGATCASIVGASATGTLTCSPRCMYDTLGCTPSLPCGDTTGLDTTSPYPMAGGCPTRIGRTTIRGPASATVRWTFDTGPHGGGAPGGISVDGAGIVYVTGRYDLFAIGLDGKAKWQTPTRSTRDGWSGTPVVGETNVYATSESTLYALNRTTGSIVWTASISGTVFLMGSPSLSGGILRVATSGLDAFQLSGSKLWSVPGTGESEPAVDAAGNSYLLTPKGPTSVTSTGAVAWRLSSSSPYAEAPAIGVDGTVYGQTQSSTLGAVSRDGKLVWSVPLASDPSAPAIASDGTVYVSAGGAVSAFRPDSSLLWSHPYPVDDGYASLGPTIGRDGTIYTVSNAGIVLGLDPAGGELWRYQLPDHSLTRPALGPDGTLYVAVNIQQVVALGPP